MSLLRDVSTTRRNFLKALGVLTAAAAVPVSIASAPEQVIESVVAEPVIDLAAPITQSKPLAWLTIDGTKLPVSSFDLQWHPQAVMDEDGWSSWFIERFPTLSIETWKSERFNFGWILNGDPVSFLLEPKGVYPSFSAKPLLLR